MTHLVKSLSAALALAALGASNVCAHIVTHGFRTAAFQHSGPSEIEVPPREPNHPSPSVIIGNYGVPVRLMVSYNAECAVDAPRGSWVSIRIVLENVNTGQLVLPQPAAGKNFAPCSAVSQKGSVTKDSVWTAVSRKVIVSNLPPGAHRVRVYGRLVNDPTGVGAWWLDDSLVAVER